MSEWRAMGEQRRYKVTDDHFGRVVFTLRERAGLTQTEVAQAVGVSERTIQHWESGTAFPSVANLKQLIALLLRYRVFQPGNEHSEAQSLWAQADTSAARRSSLFDTQWFDALLSQRELSPPISVSSSPAALTPRVDWGEAPDISAFCGREQELATLTGWLGSTAQCRVVALVGIGGMGKTTLALRAAQLVAPQFASICWRSLRDAPPLLNLLDDCLKALSIQPSSLSLQSVEHGITLLLEQLRQRRCLLILDNVETIFEAGNLAGQYRGEHAKYRLLFQRLAETPHQSCVILTSRELLSELEPMEGTNAPVRALRLAGLGRAASLELLKDKVLFGPEEAWERFVQHYAGNPLALKIAAATVRDLFGGDLLAYLSDAPGALISLQQLLADQYERLTSIERDLLLWLTIEREGVTIDQLMADIYPQIARKDLLIALKSLRQRSLIERSDPGATFALLPVVMEQLNDTLVSRLAEEIEQSELTLLTRYALMKSQSPDYIRDSQQRMLMQPALALLLARFGDNAALHAHLRSLLDLLRTIPLARQGYAGGNLINLLVSLQGHLRAENCANLALSQAYLVGVEVQDTNFSGADLSAARFTEPLEPIASMALSADGNFLAVGSFSGQIRLWHVPDSKPFWSDLSDRRIIFALAFSPDGQSVVSGNDQGQLRIWEVATGRCLRTIESGHSWIYTLAFSPDQRHLLSADDAGLIRIWQLSDGTCQQILAGHQATIWSLCFNPQGSLLISSAHDGTVRMWDTRSWQCLRVLIHSGEKVAVRAVLHPDGLLLASCGDEDGLIKLWGVNTGACLATLPRHTSGPASVAFNQEGTLLVSGSSAGMLEIWELGGPSGLSYQKILQAHRKYVNAVAFARQNLLASAAFAGRVRLWDARSGKLLKTFQGYSRLIGALCFSLTNHRLALGDNNGVVQLWDAQAGTCIQSGQRHSGTVRVIAASPDGAYFASGGDDRQIMLWDATNGELRAALYEHTALITALTFSPATPMIISGGSDGEIRFWPIAAPISALSSTRFALGPDTITAIAVSPDGRTLASGHYNGEIWLWDMAEGRCAMRLRQSSMVMSLQFQQGEMLLSGGNDGLLCWEVASGARLSAIPAETLESPVFTTMLGNHQLQMLTLPTKTMRLWAQAPSNISGFPKIADQIGEALSGSFSQNAQLVALSEDEGNVTIYSCATGEVLHRLVSDRPYERMKIAGVSGLNDEQRSALRTLGAIE